MSIVVTGASGQLGRLVARRLLDLVAPSELILVTRHPEALGQALAPDAHDATTSTVVMATWSKASGTRTFHASALTWSSRSRG